MYHPIKDLESIELKKRLRFCSFCVFQHPCRCHPFKGTIKSWPVDMLERLVSVIKATIVIKQIDGSERTPETQKVIHEIVNTHHPWDIACFHNFDIDDLEDYLEEIKEILKEKKNEMCT